MSDERLRELERRWRQTGAVEDEAVYLLEKVRVGDLDRERLNLTAYLAHPASRHALGDEAPTAPEDLKEWVGGLIQWGKECLVRASLSSAQSVISIWAERYPNDLRPQQAVEAVINWIINPCDQTREAADDAARAASRAAWAASRASRAASRASRASRAAARASRAAAAHDDARDAAYATRAATWAAQATSDVQVRTAISRDLVPWALGYRNPVREQYDALLAKAHQQTETP